MKSIATIIIVFLFTIQSIAQVQFVGKAKICSANNPAACVAKPNTNVDKGLDITSKNSTRSIRSIKKANANIAVFKKATKIEKDFTGYKIELIQVFEQVDFAHGIYQQFGDLSIQNVEEGAFNYAYFTGQFGDKKVAQDFLEAMIVSRYPGAKVVRFKNGKRK